MGKTKLALISGRQFIRSLVERGIIAPAEDILSVRIEATCADAAGRRLQLILEELGVIGPTDDMRMVVIEATHDGVTLIHTEQIADGRLLDVPLEGIAVETVGPSVPSMLQVTKAGFKLT